MELGKHEFFTFFQKEQAKTLIKSARVINFDEPGLLFDEGDEGGTMYLVLDGEVEISGLTNSGKYQAISVLTAHDFFGEFSSIDGGRRNARAYVPNRCKLGEIKREDLLKALDDSPIESLQAFFSHVVQRIRRFHNRFFSEIVRNQKMLVVGELTNSIMHDLKSPMSIITGTAEVLREKHEDSETKQLCRLIEMQVKRVQEMSSEVLDFVKGSTTIIQKQVNLKTLLPYFGLLNEEYFNRQGIQLVVHPIDISLHADPDKLVRVMQNLANNAAQAMPDGGKIEIRAEALESVVKIYVSDDGPGIPEDIRDQLFEPFVGEGKHGGTGLGTTIAQSLVQTHGGQLSFETSSEGTTFTIALPRKIDTPLSEVQASLAQ